MSDANDDDPKAEAQRRIAAMAEPREGQVYRHYKGGLYAIRCVSIMEDTLEVMVTYSSNRHGGYTTRSLDVFTERVDSGAGLGFLVPRFQREVD
jgi:hypothetical protein